MSLRLNAQEYARAHQERFVDHFRELVAIPSISTLTEHRADVLQAAQWISKELARLGMEPVEIMPTGGHPVVYGQCLNAPDKPTLLVYGHYDVQPPDPLDEWHSDPFAGEVRDDNLYGRGASDMKGQLVALLNALESIRAHGDYPVNLKFLLEGEEEIGSPHLADFIEEHRELLHCDAVLNVDAGVNGPDAPAIVYALRGLAYFELIVRGPSHDLHSGLFGGVVHNPAQVLCEVIAGMHDSEGRITLPGFYDDVRDLTDEERDLLARSPVSDEEWKRMSGAPDLRGERGYTSVERAGARPSLDVNGLLSGFTGEGSKTVLPARAMAKISMRLVPDQDAAKVREQLRAYVEAHAPATVEWEIMEHAHGPAAVMDRHSLYMQNAVEALEAVFGKKPVFRREGGSIPVVTTIKNILGVDTVMLGFGLPDDNIHGPNEKQHLPTWFRGIETYIHFLTAF